jgi:hypothetical protein
MSLLAFALLDWLSSSQPPTQRASERAISPSVFFEIDRVCGLLDLKNEREQKIFEGALGSRDLESLEKKQHRE